MAGLGIVYGPVIGTAYALAGSLIASTLAYGIGRYLGRPLVQRWLGGELERGEVLFERHGGWIVAGAANILAKQDKTDLVKAMFIHTGMLSDEAANPFAGLEALKAKLETPQE